MKPISNLLKAKSLLLLVCLQIGNVGWSKAFVS